MLGGIHFFAGASTSLLLTNNYLFAPIIGIVSHHLLDRLPHLDLNVMQPPNDNLSTAKTKVKLFVFGELIIFTLFTVILINKYFNNSLIHLTIAILGGLGGIAPDVLTILFKQRLKTFKVFKTYFDFHENFHFKLKEKKLKYCFLPILIEIIVFIICFMLIDTTAFLIKPN